MFHSNTVSFSVSCVKYFIILIVVSPAEMSRVVALIDMDCFYVQVEQRDNKAIRGRPCAVVQGTG